MAGACLRSREVRCSRYQYHCVHRWAKEMAGAFQLLRSNDLIWSKLIKDYLMGERTEMSDLMAWNADATRMAYRMHSEYLRSLFLNNDFAEGRYYVDDKPVAMRQHLISAASSKAMRDYAV